MRNGGSSQAHLSSSLATLLGLPFWLTPPHRALEPLTLERVCYVATYALAQYNVIMIDMAIQLPRACLTQHTELAEHAQRVEAARCAALAK